MDIVPRRFRLQERPFELARRVVKLCQSLDQVSRVSWSRADFIEKYSIACKESRETNYRLRLLVASEVVPESEVVDLNDE